MPDRLSTLTSFVEFLCSPECGGRRTATRENEAARGRIIDELRAIGVEPAGTQGFEQPVHAAKGANVIARLRGAGALADRTVLVCAHYDHLGWARKKDVAYWGADDNAAGVGIMLDAARQLSERSAGHPNRRQILFIAFDAEEPPFFRGEAMGSMHFVREPTVPLENIDMMICMDLVGHALGHADFPPSIRKMLFVLGAERSAGTGAIIDRVAQRANGVVPRRMGIDVVPAMSDYHAFELAAVPFLFLTCARWEHYHEVTDTPEKLDYQKCLATADMLVDLTLELAARPEAKVAFDAEARDDRAALDTIDTIAREAGSDFEGQTELLQVARAMREHLSPDGVLPLEDQELLASVVGMIEDELQRL